MPGLFGVVGLDDGEELGQLLAQMAQALKHEQWYRVDVYQGDGVGLGRVGLGIVNPEPQPIWNEDGSLCIIMEGEVFDYGDEKRRLLERGHRFSVDNDAEYVLHLFEELGSEAPVRLNGAFVAAIWDSRNRRLTLLNDRLGLRPLYYVQRNGCLFFASSVGALMADPALSQRVDPIAMAQFLCFDHVLGNRTLLSEVQLLPPAQLATFSDGRLAGGAHWRLVFPEVYQVRSEEDYLEELIHHLKQAVNRQARGDLPMGVSLSGGLDSRTIAAFLSEIPRTGRLHTFTFGIPGCHDARFARDICAVLGTQHHFYELRPDYLLDIAEQGVRLTDGMQNCVHMHMLAPLPAEAQHVRALYIGFMGDVLMGHGIDRQMFTYCDESTAVQVHFAIHLKQNLIVFPPPEQKELFSEDLQRRIGDAVFDSYRAVFAEATSKLAADQRTYFDLRQRMRRMTLMGPEEVRSQVEVRTPFCDNDLVGFVLSLPPGLRLERYLMLKAIARAFPNVAKVPTEKTLLPLVACFRDLRIRADNQVRWRLRAAGLKWVPEHKHRPYADYNGWMRTVLRPWVEETLLSKRALERGYFNPATIQRLVAEHMAGANHERKLGGLLALELWHRQFID